MKFEGEGEANDAGSSDADVGVVHGISLVRSRRGYSLGAPVCSQRSVIGDRYGCARTNKRRCKPRPGAVNKTRGSKRDQDRGEGRERRVRRTEVNLGSIAWRGGRGVAGRAGWTGVVLRFTESSFRRGA